MIVHRSAIVTKISQTIEKHRKSEKRNKISIKTARFTTHNFVDVAFDDTCFNFSGGFGTCPYGKFYHISGLRIILKK